MPKTCRWHKCRAAFEPVRVDQEFCSGRCRNNRAAWRQARGSRLVDLVIEGKWKELREAREQLNEEIK